MSFFPGTFVPLTPKALQTQCLFPRNEYFSFQYQLQCKMSFFPGTIWALSDNSLYLKALFPAQQKEWVGLNPTPNVYFPPGLYLQSLISADYGGILFQRL